MIELQSDDDDVSSELSFAEQRSRQQRKRTDALPIGCPFDGPIVDVALIGAELSSTLFLAKNASSQHECDTTSPIYQSLPLNVKYVVDTKSDLTYFASANGTGVTKYGDLATLVKDVKTHNFPVEPLRVTGMELSMPCMHETENVDATIAGQIGFISLVKPAFVVVQMKIVHTHSNDSHRTVAKDFFDIGYYTNVTGRVSSSVCGDITDQSRWILFGHKFPGSSFDMLAYSNNCVLDQHFTRHYSVTIQLRVYKIGRLVSTDL